MFEVVLVMTGKSSYGASDMQAFPKQTSSHLFRGPVPRPKKVSCSQRFAVTFNLKLETPAVNPIATGLMLRHHGYYHCYYYYYCYYYYNTTTTTTTTITSVTTTSTISIITRGQGV